MKTLTLCVALPIDGNVIINICLQLIASNIDLTPNEYSKIDRLLKSIVTLKHVFPHYLHVCMQTLNRELTLDRES